MARDGIRSFGLDRDRGAVTLVSLCLTTTLGIALASYLALSSRSAQLSNRMLTVEKTQQLAQVGLEEALWALNQNSWTSSGPAGNTAWAISGANRTTTLTFSLSDQASSGQVALTIANYASTGPVWPTITAISTVTLQGGQTFTQTLQATTGPAPLFGNAIASAESFVSFTQGGTVDSWNSDPDNNSATAAVGYSFTAGNPTNYAAVVAGRTNGTYGVLLTQATVRGYVATFGLPVSYSTSASPSAKIIGPTTPSGVNIDTARIGKSAFVPVSEVFPITLPATNGANYGGLINNLITLASSLLSPPAGVDVFKTSGNLQVSGLPLLAPNITVSNHVKLIVDGDLIIGGGLGLGKITVTSTGWLEIFVTGDVTIGSHGVDNQTNDPKKFSLFCTGASTTDAVEFDTSENFCGVVFCENKPIDIKKNATFFGALLSRQSIRFMSNATNPVFHYDTSLRNARFTGVSTPYIVKKVSEL